MKTLSELIQKYGEPNALIDHWDKNSKRFAIWEFEEIASRISNTLLKYGIIVRELSSFGWPNCIRISVGTDYENKTFIKTLKKIL